MPFCGIVINFEYSLIWQFFMIRAGILLVGKGLHSYGPCKLIYIYIYIHIYIYRYRWQYFSIELQYLYMRYSSYSVNQFYLLLHAYYLCFCPLSCINRSVDNFFLLIIYLLLFAQGHGRTIRTHAHKKRENEIRIFLEKKNLKFVDSSGP